MNINNTFSAVLQTNYVLPCLLLIGFGIPLLLYNNMKALDIHKTFVELDKELIHFMNRSYTLLSMIKSVKTENRKTGAFYFQKQNNTNNKNNNYNSAVSDRNRIIFSQPPIGITKNSLQRETTARPLICYGCFKYAPDVLINNENICNSKEKSVKMLILISSAPNHAMQRKAIRDTWLKDLRQENATIKYVFLLGDSIETPEVAKESSITADIIVGNFIDVYSNLTLKTLFGFKWTSRYCNQTQFIMKTDDDMYVNIPNLHRTIDLHWKTLQTSVGGSCAQLAHPIRSKSSKWYASYRNYPQKTYPGFCSGTGYVTSINVVNKILDISKHIPFFYLEDVYVALCVKQLGYRLQGLHGFLIGHNNDPCFFKGPSLVTAHRISPKWLKLIWEKQCERQKN